MSPVADADGDDHAVGALAVGELLDDLRRVVVVPDGVGGAEGQRLLLLVRHRVDGDDRARVLVARALDRVDADAADADDHHDVADLHVGGVDRRAPARRDAAADQRGLVERDVGVDLDHGVDRHADVGRECPEVGHAADALPAGVDAVGAVGGDAGEHARAERAHVRAPGDAHLAAPARRQEGEDDVVADLEVVDFGADLGHDSGSLVPAEDRCPRERDHPVVEVLVGVADPGRRELDHHLAALGRIDLDLFDAPARVGPGLPEQRSHGLHRSPLTVGDESDSTDRLVGAVPPSPFAVGHRVPERLDVGRLQRGVVLLAGEAVLRVLLRHGLDVGQHRRRPGCRPSWSS